MQNIWTLYKYTNPPPHNIQWTTQNPPPLVKNTTSQIHAIIVALEDAKFISINIYLFYIRI